MNTIITKQDITKYNMTAKDIVNCKKYMRSVDAFYVNRWRAQAHRHIERDLGLTQDEFARYPRYQRLSLVNLKIDEFRKTGGAPKMVKPTMTERLIRRSSHDARIKNQGQTITKPRKNTFHKIYVQDTDQMVIDFIRMNGEPTHCALTGIEFVDGDNMLAPSVDHIVPISHNGPHVATNIQFILRGLNRAKGTASQDEFKRFLIMIRSK